MDHTRQRGEIVTSFTLLTVNADTNPLMCRMHRPGKEKRMRLIILPANYETSLSASLEEAQAMMRMIPTQALIGEPAPTAVQHGTGAQSKSVRTAESQPLF